MMRRSFGGGSGGMGGGGADSNGGGMLRAVQRAVRTGGTLNGAAQESSHSSTITAKTWRTATNAFNNNKGSNASTALSLSSSSPFSTIPWDSSSYNTEEGEDWECLDGYEDEKVNIVFDDYILGPVPSTDEVHHAVSALQHKVVPDCCLAESKTESHCTLLMWTECPTSSFSGTHATSLNSSGCNLDKEKGGEELRPERLAYQNNAIIRQSFRMILQLVKISILVGSSMRVLEPSYFSCSSNNSLGYKSNEDTTDELTSSINLTREVLSSSGSVSDWIEPSMHICNSKLLQSYGSSRVYDAFHLLQTEPSIQKMVISLSSDKAVWDAFLNNEAVREIRDSLKPVDAADNGLPARSSEEGFDKSDSDGTIDIISWIVVNTKGKMMEIVEKIIDVVNEWFQPPEKEKTSEGNTDSFDEKLRTSFFLSVVVLLVVVVARAQCA
ncbi:hypothetical protein RND71_030481 [Anisodus tanguticus]|uniref:Uncharacterized protein n=1 Tax=Anisodus tanguticus TaxID=243964 RepID=A0AAE1RHM6_9SOLA|nr:hypothetical protein RND71_030481 [Anisodus tanguticus]